MSKEFIKKRVGLSDIEIARRQQDQILYNTRSDVQGIVTAEYLESWATRNYSTKDYFLNYVKSILRTPNFLTFYKYFRFPAPSSKVVNGKIKDQLKRVFFSEDAHFDITLRDEQIPFEDKTLLKEIFEKLFYRFNDIVVIDSVNGEAFESFVEIDKVIAIRSYKSVIKQIAYTATTVIDGESVTGYAYVDEESYKFYDKDVNLVSDVPHDLGYCPAHYVSGDPFTNDIVRESIFTNVKPELEEYNFLKTLQRMSDANGVLPVVTKLDADEEEGTPQDLGDPNEPMGLNVAGQQKSKYGSEFNPGKSSVQAGTVLELPVMRKNDGSIDVDLVQNYISFFYLPVDAMTFLKDRINELARDIVSTVVGDYTESNDVARNESDVARSFVSKSDKLRDISYQIGRLATDITLDKLLLENGPGTATVDIFMGSDFFIETQADIYDMYEKAPNPIERKNLMIRLAQNRNRFNPKKAQREVILNHLLPYSDDTDFETAISNQLVDDTTKQYQTRFNYWIGVFEATYGDVVSFWNMIDGEQSEKLMLVNNLIIQIITDANSSTS